MATITMMVVREVFIVLVSVLLSALLTFSSKGRFG